MLPTFTLINNCNYVIICLAENLTPSFLFQQRLGLVPSVLDEVLLDCHPPGFTGQFPNCADENRFEMLANTIRVTIIT